MVNILFKFLYSPKTFSGLKEWKVSTENTTMNFIDMYWNYFKYLPLAYKYFEADKNAQDFIYLRN